VAGVTSANWLDLDGAENARDVGGLPTADGHHIRPGRLLRSDSPVGLSSRDVRHLVDEVGVDTVIDLRTGVEVRGEGHGPLADEPGVEVHHLSLFPEPPPPDPTDRTAATDPDHENGRNPAGRSPTGPEVLPWQDPDSERARASARRTYLRYLDERPDSVLTALRLIAHGSGATLVHCAAGKDRTGVVVALALESLGVSRDAIVADYVATDERIEGIMSRLAASPTYANDDGIHDIDRHRPRATTIEGFLDELNRDDGGAGAWLRRHGWTDADDAALRDRLLD
jgi:protein-tyrosine phosphatase